ncbi:MAG: META domain-containing protein [Saprospiraceae bacterium]
MKKRLFFLFSVTILLYSCQPSPIGGTIENTYWTLTSYTLGRKVLTPSQGVHVTLHFAEKQVAGDAPCNSYFGSFNADGVNLNLSNIASTERMCDGIDLETSYLGLLSKAHSFSVRENTLEIFCENGKLVFAPMTPQEVKLAERQRKMEKLLSLFPQMEGDIMPHLYPIVRVDKPGTYPYLGNLVDTSFFQLFDTETANVWRNGGGEVFAVGKYDDFYVCRVPGRYVSSDIALFQRSKGSLARSETIAWAWCDEGWCNQQDAWLRDVNRDGRMDIIQHYTLTDDKGKLQEERMTVLLQNEAGTFEENKDLKPDKSQFEMAKI